MTTSSEIAVAFLSRRTRTTRAVEDQPHDRLVPSDGRAFQASQSVCTLRHTRLTVSLPIRPAEQRGKRAADPTRRWSPTDYAEAISASGLALVRR